jgi:dihydrodipicolinate synthase/N-acetylneuraminate lyase
LLLAWNKDDSLDFGRVEAELDAITAFGVDGVYSNGTAGEFHSLTEDEFDAISELLAARCEAASIPFQIGVSHMSAQISLERLRRSVALAPAAFQVILPDWYPVSDAEAIAFLNRMAENAEGVGLVLYNPPHAKRMLPPETMGALRRAVPSMVGVKVADGNDDWYAAVREHLSSISVFVPGHHLATGFARGASGAYSNVACLHPGAAQRWWDLMAEDIDSALEVEQRLRMFMDQRIVPFITEQGYCPAACDRLLAHVGGWADVGERMRWPYRSIPFEEADRLRPIAREMLPEFFLC